METLARGAARLPEEPQGGSDARLEEHRGGSDASQGGSDARQEEPQGGDLMPGSLLPGFWRTARDLLQVKISWLVSRQDLFFMSPMWVNEIVLQGKAHWG
jgi:hypothetical protein